MKQARASLFIKLLIAALFFETSNNFVFGQEEHSKSKPKNAVSNIGGSFHSKSTDKKAHRGGRNTLPIGIEGKKINIGIGSGLAIPSLSLKTEEHVMLGSNTHFYAHYIINGRSSYGIGINTNFIFLNTDVTKFYNENQNLYHAKVYPWSLFTISPSFLINFSIKPRVSAQFVLNSGALMATIPQSQLNFIDSTSAIGEPVVVVNRDYIYQTGTQTGWFASGIFQFNYALSRHLEVRAGIDYFYGRFNYQRINISNPLTPTTEKTLRELKLIDLFGGLAISF